MAKISYYLDTRKLRKDGTAPLRIVIRNGGSTAYLPMGVYIKPEQWDKEKSTLRVIRSNRKAEYPNRESVTLMLDRRLVDIQNYVTQLPWRMSAVDIRDAVDSHFNNKKNDGVDPKTLFLAVFESYLESCSAKRTKEIYQATITAMKKYAPNLDTLTFEQITDPWLRGFDLALSKTSPSPNARAVHLRNIRAVFNRARILGITNQYPFLTYKIKTVETPKRALYLDSMRKMAHYQVSSEIRPRDAALKQKYVDIFNLIFLLCGINIVDLCNLKHTSVVNGRIEYYRQKTGTFYSIKLEPEAQEIINKYKGKEYLLDINECYKSYKIFGSQMNKALQNLGKERSHLGRGGGHLIGDSEFPGITTYWARYTWATLADELDISIETISSGLGHKIGSKITNIYIRKDLQKVDIANRKIIDYVWYPDGENVKCSESLSPRC